MLFHLWLFAVQSHKRLHSITLFSSQTGHPYFRPEGSENIDGLRYYGFVCSRSTTARYLQSQFKMLKLRSLHQRQCIHVFVPRITQRAHLEVPYFRIQAGSREGFKSLEKYRNSASLQQLILVLFVAPSIVLTWSTNYSSSPLHNVLFTSPHLLTAGLEVTNYN